MNDAERWINLEGPPPEGIRELLDAASDVPDMTPELEAELDRRLFTAIAEDRRAWARRKTRLRALRWGLVAACLATAIVLALRSGAPSTLELARRILPDATRSAPNQLGGTEGTAPAPPGSGSARPAKGDGATRRPRER